ncbi:Uncharacterised protein [uncultured Clostridium sp.]|nr:Uncharacterised protein [uncultured Clostridium sp.]
MNQKQIYEEIVEWLRINGHTLPEGGAAEQIGFFGEPLKLNYRDMMYLCAFLEARYGIHFTPQDMDAPAFYTPQGLSARTAEHILE